MNSIFQRYKRLLELTALVWTVLLLLFIIRIATYLNLVDKTAESIYVEANKIPASTQNNKEIVKLKKDILWFEQQIALSESDSFSLGINLRDSVVQVQLKGTVLFQAPIIKQYPADFMQYISQSSYFYLFGKPATIAYETANIPKKPIKKVTLEKKFSEQSKDIPDSLADIPLHWEFFSNNKMPVIISGVRIQQDSTYATRIRREIFNYGMGNMHQFSSSKNYFPPLFLWLDDQDARAIFRALPSNARVVFRN